MQLSFEATLPPSGGWLEVPPANPQYCGGIDVGGLRWASLVVNNLLTSVCDHFSVSDLWPLTAFPTGAELLRISQSLAEWHPAFLALSPCKDTSLVTQTQINPVRTQDRLYSEWGVCCTSVPLWLHTVKLALSLVYLGIKNIWGVLWLKQSFLLGSMHEPSLFLFLVLCKCTTVAAMNCLDVLRSFFSVRSCSEWDSPGVIFSLLIRFIIFSLFLSTSTWSLTLSFLPTNSPQTHQSNHAPLWSPLYIHFSVKKKWDASLTKGQNMAHSPCQAYSFSLSGPFYSPVHLCVEQWRTGVQGGGFWQDGNTMTHQRPGETASGHVSQPGRVSSLFCGWLSLRRQRWSSHLLLGGWSFSLWTAPLQQCPLLSDALITFHFWHLSVQQLQQVRRFHCSPVKCSGNIIVFSFPKPWPLCPRLPAENRIFFFLKQQF